MTLTTHAIVGAAIVSIMPAHPVIGVCAAFASHFVLDAIPHYDYQIRSEFVHPHKVGNLRFERALFLDILTIGGDALAGILLGLFFFATPTTWLLVALGAAVAIAPDPMQFVWSRWKHEPLNSLQRFHNWTHTKVHLRGHPVFGAVSQACFAVACVLVFMHLPHLG